VRRALGGATVRCPLCRCWRLLTAADRVVLLGNDGRVMPGGVLGAIGLNLLQAQPLAALVAEGFGSLDRDPVELVEEFGSFVVFDAE
jgi:hypothetical protein